MKFIVSLTSYGKRLERTTPYAIYSLLNQSESPDKTILWLKHNTVVPPILQKLCALGLEIRFCNDFKSYKKLVPALLQFPDDVIITADDDVYYPNDWFAKLKKEFLRYPRRICIHRAHRILFDQGNKVLPYKDWLMNVKDKNSNALILPTGVGGVLYPPGSLEKICTDEKLFLKLAPNCDDIWFWAMAQLKGTKYSLVKNGYRNVRTIDSTDVGLWTTNINRGRNDKQLQNIIKRFPEITKIIVSRENEAAHRKIDLERPLVSVVMPCYNSSEYIGRAIESILEQTLNNFEFIIIDDCSTDNTRVEINKYLSDQRIKHIQLEANVGNYAARNMGIKLAKGSFIAVMDADDISDKNRMLIQYEYLEKHKRVDCVGSQGYAIDGADRITGNLNKPTNLNLLKIYLLKDNYTIHPSLMYRKSFLIEHKLMYDERYRYSADYDFVSKVSIFGKIVNLPDRLIKYRIHSHQISNLKHREQKDFADKIRLGLLKHFNVRLSTREVELFQKVMKDQRIVKKDFNDCLLTFNKLIQSNDVLKLYSVKLLYDFFNSSIIKAYKKED